MNTTSPTKDPTTEPTVVAYARYSSDLQKDTSIDDQVRNCTRVAEARGWTISHTYADRGISGTTTERPEFQAMVAAGVARKFDVLIIDDLSRLSRDQIDSELTFRRLEGRGVTILGASDGYSSESKSRKIQRFTQNLMNEMFIDSLREKVARGMEGAARRGGYLGGRPYGYRRILTDSGTNIEIDPEQAQWVRYIFERFTLGSGGRHIASELNTLGIPGPRGGAWEGSSIYGHRNKKGILRNPIYIGQYQWNRSHGYIDVETKKRVRVINSQSDIITTEREDLRIIDDTTWAKAQARLSGLVNPPRAGAHRKYLFSGLLRCGRCGSSWTVGANGRYCCSGRKYKGLAFCNVAKTVKVKVLEAKLLLGMWDSMRTPANLEYARERYVNSQNAESSLEIQKHEEELTILERKIESVTVAIADGYLGSTLIATLNALEASRDRIKSEIDTILSNRKPPSAEFLAEFDRGYLTAVADLEKELAQHLDRQMIHNLIGADIIIRDTPEGLIAELPSGTYSLSEETPCPAPPGPR